MDEIPRHITMEPGLGEKPYSICALFSKFVEEYAKRVLNPSNYVQNEVVADQSSPADGRRQLAYLSVIFSPMFENAALIRKYGLELSTV